MVSPSSPKERLTTVLPFPITSHAAPARGTTSTHVRMFVFGKVVAGNRSANWPAVVFWLGKYALYLSTRTPRFRERCFNDHVSVTKYPWLWRRFFGSTG